MRPALVIPDNRINPAQGRQPVSTVLQDVAAARERCVDKIEHVEEIEYDQVVSSKLLLPGVLKKGVQCLDDVSK